MNTTRRYPRTLDEAFHDARYANPIQHYPRSDVERVGGFVLVMIIGICLAAALVHWWAS